MALIWTGEAVYDVFAFDINPAISNLSLFLSTDGLTLIYTLIIKKVEPEEFELHSINDGVGQFRLVFKL